MIERLIFRLLSEGITELTNEPTRITQAFCELGLDVKEAKRIRALFEKTPPKVIHNYPRANSEFPLYCIVLGSERESVRALNDFGGFVTVDQAAAMMDPSLAYTEIKTSIYNHEFNILTYTEHPDVTIYYYQLAKLMLTRARNEFYEAGLLNTSFSGADLNPAKEYAPDWLFVRRLTFSCMRENPVLDEKIPVGTSIGNAHVNNPDASEADVVGVTASVTPYTDS